MQIHPPKGLAIGLAAAVALLSGCGGPADEPTKQPTVTMEQTVEASAQETMAVDESDPSEPPASPSSQAPASQPGASPFVDDPRSPDAPDVGAITELTPAATQYFTTLCQGVRDVKQLVPDVSTLGYEQAKAKIVEAYKGMGGRFEQLATKLEAMDKNLGFDGADAFVAYQAKELRGLGAIYAKGAAAVQKGKDEASVQEVITTTENEAVVANTSTFGLDALDADSIQLLNTKIPGCR